MQQEKKRQDLVDANKRANKGRGTQTERLKAWKPHEFYEVKDFMKKKKKRLKMVNIFES
jgi:hypothetical protein